MDHLSDPIKFEFCFTQRKGGLKVPYFRTFYEWQFKTLKESKIKSTKPYQK